MTRTQLRARLSPVLALFAGILFLASCTDPNEPDPVTKIQELPRALTGAEQELIVAGQAFSFEFLAGVAADEVAGANIFVSPLSASMALGMALAGAENETYTAMRDALGLQDLSREEIGDAYESLIELLAGLDPSVRVEIGNSVWLRSGFEPESAYVADVEEHFDARVSTLDFDDPAAADTINGWVVDATDGRIDGIVAPPIDPMTVAFLINAIYFQGDWTLQFDPSDTHPGEFTRADGVVVQAPFMHMSDGEFPFAWGSDHVAVELPYGGEAFSMVVVVPDPAVGLEAFVSSLDADAWAGILAGLAPAEAMIALPKFTLEYEKTLNEVLKALGMEPAFVPSEADFSRMHRDALNMELHISRVKQKAFVEVDEKGTTAAAVTSVEVGVTSAPPMLVADRPFLFAIRERLSGTILFVGLVHDPTAE